MKGWLIGIAVLLGLDLALLGFALWVLYNVRDDQLVIRTWIARELRARGVYVP